MKRIITIILISVLLPLRAFAGTVERTYVTTDKTCYVAGDKVWLSAFCVDATDGLKLSEFSSLAYVELCSAEGVVATAKLALVKGRGAGSMTLPRSLATGNYKLIAYTAQNRNEEGYDFLSSSRTISVFNTFTSERAEGVKIVSDGEYSNQVSGEDRNTGVIGVSLVSKDSKKATVEISGMASKAVSMSVSVYREDGIKSPSNGGLEDFAAAASAARPSSFSQNIIPDFEGEVITGHLAGADAAAHYGDRAVISSPGTVEGFYFSNVSPEGEVKFFTNNVYGDNVLVCQLMNESEDDVYIELDSPFVDNKAGETGSLSISKSIAQSLSDRSAAMQICRLFDADTLYDILPKRPNLTLDGDEVFSYILKDYTRFPVMNEVFVEFMKGLSFRSDHGKRYVRCLMLDATKTGYPANDGALVLVDGTPVFDHQKIYDYDPLIVERIDVYPSTYFFGPCCCNGVVSFVTYKQNMPGLTFPENVRIVDFQGAGVPCAYTCRNISENADYPDYRNTIYWHPDITLKAGETRSIECQLPSYESGFRVVVEGLAEDGTPFHETILF